MLREVAEGATRIDQDTFRHLVRVVATMGTIVAAGRRTGEVREINPLLAHLTTVWPIMVYLAAGPIRHNVSGHSSIDTSDLEPTSCIRHMQDVPRRSFTSNAPARAVRRTTSSREHAS